MTREEFEREVREHFDVERGHFDENGNLFTSPLLYINHYKDKWHLSLLNHDGLIIFGSPYIGFDSLENAVKDMMRIIALRIDESWDMYENAKATNESFKEVLHEKPANQN